MTTTTPLPPSLLQNSPNYNTIKDLIDSIWDMSFKIEQEYYDSKNSNLIQQFAMNIVIIQFWEDLHMRMTEERAKPYDKEG